MQGGGAVILLLCMILGAQGATIISYFPTNGPVTGGTQINITGEGFIERGTDRTRCRFRAGGLSSRVASINILSNSTHMVCTMPDVSTLLINPLSPNGATIQLAVTGAGRQVSNFVIFLVYDLSFYNISQITPNQTLTNSTSTSVAIYGTNFLNTGEITCSLDSEPLMVVMANFSTSSCLQCFLPSVPVASRQILIVSFNGQLVGTIPANASAVTITFFSPPPLVISTHFRASYVDIILQFDREVEIGPEELPGSLQHVPGTATSNLLLECSQVLDTESAQIIGKTASCSWLNTQQRAVVITLTADSNVTVGSVMRLDGCFIRTRYVDYSRLASGDITVHGMDLSPSVILEVPQIIPVCGDFLINGDKSLYGGYRDLLYEWSVGMTTDEYGNVILEPRLRTLVPVGYSSTSQIRFSASSFQNSGSGSGSSSSSDSGSLSDPDSPSGSNSSSGSDSLSGTDSPSGTGSPFGTVFPSSTGSPSDTGSPSSNISHSGGGSNADSGSASVSGSGFASASASGSGFASGSASGSGSDSASASGSGSSYVSGSSYASGSDFDSASGSDSAPVSSSGFASASSSVLSGSDDIQNPVGETRYLFQLTVRNLFGSTSSFVVGNLTRVMLPPVFILGGQERSGGVLSDIFLEGKITGEGWMCGEEILIVRFSWTLESVQGDTVSLEGTRSNVSALFLPPCILQPGVRYRATLAVSLTGSSSTFVSTYLNIKEELTAWIAGGIRRSAAVGDILTLDGSSSIIQLHPESQLSVAWNCSTEAVPEISGSPSCQDFDENSNITFSLAPGSLSPGGYVFSLILSTTGARANGSSLSSSYSQEVMVYPASVPSVQIVVKPHSRFHSVLIHEKKALEAEVRTNRPAMLYWTVEYVQGKDALL